MNLIARPPRLAFLLLRGLDHFVHDLIATVPFLSGWDAKAFHISGPQDVEAALAWTDRPDSDALWFEFCWPPFPQILKQTDFGGRRVIVRVHRIEAMETPHVAQTAWQNVHDVIVVSTEMAARVRKVAPMLERTTRLHIIHNGLDHEHFLPLISWNKYRIGWCG